MRLLPERDPTPRLLALAYFALAVTGTLLLRLWPTAVLHLAQCPLREIFGLPCVTCGGTHAAVALSELRFGDAVCENPLVVLVAVALGAWALCSIAATVVPSWRRQIALSAREARLLRWLAVVIVVGVWIYEIVRLT